MVPTATVNTVRYVYGDAQPVKAPWKGTYNFNIGDIMYEDNTDTVTPPDQAGALYPVKPCYDFTWQSAISDPIAGPTATAISAASLIGPGFAAGTSYKVQYTYVTPDGPYGTYLESGPSSYSSAIVIATGGGIAITGVSVPSGVQKVNWYVTNGTGTTPQLAASTLYGASVNLTVAPPATAPAPPAANGLSALVLTQFAFVQQFLGVSAQYYNGNSFGQPGAVVNYGVTDGYTRIDAGGVFNFVCATATFNVGDLVGVAKDTGNNLAGQTVVAVSSKALAIGRVEQGTYQATTVLVRINPVKPTNLSQVTF